MFSVLFWLIGIGAGIWWWLDCPPPPVAMGKVKKLLYRFMPFGRRAKPNKKTDKSQHSAAAKEHADLTTWQADRYVKLFDDEQTPRKAKQYPSSEDFPLIDRAEIKQNLIASLNRQRRYSNLQNPRAVADSLPAVDEASVRERVRAIHRKRLAQQQAKPAPLKTVVLRPSAKRSKTVEAAVLRETNHHALKLGGGDAFIPSESVLLQMSALHSSTKSLVPLAESDDVPFAFLPSEDAREAADMPDWDLPVITVAVSDNCNFSSSVFPEIDEGQWDNSTEEPISDEDRLTILLPPHLIESAPAPFLGAQLAMQAAANESAVFSPENAAVIDTSPVVSRLIPVVNLTLAAPETLPLPFSAPKKPSMDYTGFRLPSVDLLQPPDRNEETLSEEALLARGRLIEEKLAEFKVSVTVADAYAGPVITRYEIEPAIGVRGNQIVNLAKDLARSLGLVSMRVVETIPGKTCMGLELPNPKRQMIRLSEILSSQQFLASPSRLALALGHDIIGQPVVMDLAKAPHLLVAGTTGSGKSVGVNAMILSMLYKATPEEVRLIMIDPKMLELSVYNDIPHLLAPVVTDMKLAAHALSWCVNEMERRYRLMSTLGVRNLAGFNQKIHEATAQGMHIADPFSLTPDNPESLDSLPFIVVVVDEFADLMMVAGKKIEELIARLAQKARAAGIHLILATQRPSVDVITGLIKANIPTRIAFQVSSKVDSRTILDQMGAETLLGQGDMLFLPPGTGYPLRVHGAFVADDEVHRVAEYLKQFGEPDYVEDLLHGPEPEESTATGASRVNAEEDPLYDEAVSIVLKTRKASISSVQRQLRIGYNRAARLIEQMEEGGLVSPMENNGNRTVLVPDREF